MTMVFKLLVPWFPQRYSTFKFQVFLMCLHITHVRRILYRCSIHSFTHVRHIFVTHCRHIIFTCLTHFFTHARYIFYTCSTHVLHIFSMPSSPRKYDSKMCPSIIVIYQSISILSMYECWMCSAFCDTVHG